MNETPFELPVGDRAIQGHFGGTGVPALLLHGGPGFPDYMEPCAAELGNLFTTIRYTQRGVEPSDVGGPYTIEQHVADAVAILDLFEQEKTWAIGHSWGGHLALHLAVAHPERLYGIVCIDPLAANEAVLPELRENLRAQLTGEEIARIDEIERHEAEGTATEDELLESLRIVWAAYFFDKTKVTPCPIAHVGVEASIEADTSMMKHFAARTLKKGVRKIAMPALFVHGIQDPLPLRASLQTAKRIPGARVARVANCGHYPWLEQPGFVNRYIRGLIATL